MSKRILATALALGAAIAMPAHTRAETRPPSSGRTTVPTIKIQIVSATGNKGNLSETQACAPPEWKIIGGGASVRFDGPGGLLTASYPEGNCWRAESKAHEQPDDQAVTAFAIVLYDPKDEWEVAIEQATGDVSAHPTAQVRVRPGYVMTGGGARVDWSGAGNLLTASFPVTADVWEARAKDHNAPNPASVTVYAIGLRAKNGAALKSTLETVQSGSKPHPRATINLPDGWTMTGGGARVNWKGIGNLLFESAPSGDQAWSARSKDHVKPSPASITAFVIGIKP